MKYIKSVGIKKEESKVLNKKAIEMTINSNRPVKASEIVHFLIEELTE